MRITPRTVRRSITALMLTAAALINVAPLAADVPVEFERDIKPIFAEHCVECHGPDKAKAGLNLATRTGALAALKSGVHAIVPGEPNRSELIVRVTTDDAEDRMPPADKSDPLTAQQIDTLRRWIAQGAEWQVHWAYRPIVRHDPPAVRDASWGRNDIDRFVLARLEAEGIKPNPSADRYTLIKRLYYDLIGLPPTPEQVDRFVNDKSPKAYEKLVDGLLASPRFGERWGRHWLDKARYADSDGYEKDRPRPNAWKYRDWVIDAVNNDMPFDRFTIEQIAGDLLPDATESQKLATAFNRQTLTNTEGGTDKEQWRVEAVFDRVETTGAVWLGLTLTCARCHTHKYDTITQHEYFQLFAFYNNGDETNMDIARSEEAMAKYREDKAAHDLKVAAVRDKLDAARDGLAERQAAWERDTLAKLDATKDPVAYHPLDVERYAADGEGVKFNEQDDGSVLLSNASYKTENYAVFARSDVKNVTGFRIEALPDKSLKANGPGRAGNGNFVLTDFRVYVGADNFDEAERVKIARADADFNQDKYHVKDAIDDDVASGWAISPQFGKRHAAHFWLAEPIELDGTYHIRVELDQQYGNWHTLGRFRVTAITGTQPTAVAPDDIVKILRTDDTKRTDKQRKRLADHYASINPATSKLAAQLDELDKKAPKVPTMSVRVISDRTNNPRTTHVLNRGDFLQPTDKVEPDTLDVLPPITARDPKAGVDRLDFARWLVDADNPITPRVTVNQIWQHLFGEGLVRTMNDFGVRGEPPTHPKLIDWLATEYIRLGWSRKAMIKTIVMSSTYRMASTHRPELVDRDATNRLLYRQNRTRVEAEIVRDLSLGVAGLLSDKVGGPSVFPPMPEDVAALSYANNFKWKTSEGEDRYRRGMYTFFKRTAPHPNLVAFDCPDSNTTAVVRRVSNTPLQALTTLNNEVFTEAAQAFARRVLTTPGDDASRLRYALRLCVSRPASAAETDELSALLTDARAYYKQHPDEAKKLTESHAAKGVDAAENAAWVTVCRTLLNLDEFLTRE